MKTRVFRNDFTDCDPVSFRVTYGARGGVKHAARQGALPHPARKRGRVWPRAERSVALRIRDSLNIWKPVPPRGTGDRKIFAKLRLSVARPQGQGGLAVVIVPVPGLRCASPWATL